MKALVTSLLTLMVVTYCSDVHAETTTTPNDSGQSVVYSWVTVDYDWPNDSVRQEYINDGRFIVASNIITGIKVFEDEVYVTVPRWRPGVPSTLNRVVMKNGSAVLQPFPSWSHQRERNCAALQYVQSMEVDPNTGLMWIIDNGRTNLFSTTGPSANLCPPKLVIYDIKGQRQVHSYTFPSSVANPESCFLNDIVLHYVSGDVRYAYITDTMDAKIYVYNYAEDSSYFFQHSSMQPEHSHQANGTPVDGIAMSADFRFVYYCPIDGKGLFQIPTAVLSNPTADFGQHVRRVGTRLSRSDGLAYGQRSLFYGLLDLSGVQRWLVAQDAETRGYADVTMTSEEDLARDAVRMRWVDTFAWDESGNLWFTANDLARFFPGDMDFTGASGPNMYVWKVFVNESSYLSAKAAGSDVSSGAWCVSAGKWPDGVLVMVSVLFMLLKVVDAKFGLLLAW